MNTIDDSFTQARAEGRSLISFEIFPPKGDLPLETARSVASELTRLEPDFISVTFSAGGSGNKQATADVASIIQNRFNTPVMAHLTCVNATRESIQNTIEDYKDRGVKNILALRGDPVAGADTSEFHYAKDLIPLLKDEGFCVGAAAYVEGHVSCLSERENIEHLKQKQDAGADFFVTQLFFDNKYYYRFREKADAAGITAPISCGIMPFLSKSQIERMVFMCGASLPAPIVKLLAKYEDDPASLRQAGVEYAVNQLLDLQKHGAAGLHVYTMNHPDIAEAATRALRNA